MRTNRTAFPRPSHCRTSQINVGNVQSNGRAAIAGQRAVFPIQNRCRIDETRLSLEFEGTRDSDTQRPSPLPRGPHGRCFSGIGGRTAGLQQPGRDPGTSAVGMRSFALASLPSLEAATPVAAQLALLRHSETGINLLA
ncbi:unnamed protein product [Ostreobium quekettii]|uniref:Uncharacterized protein n=1 Tax=Ostreobium quekettii TaxID=121088 RepID=A0A8S1JEK2_9CHLO|nr:unnamed protein product [Ostreobium quekettii]|eukprot:evm.model.scf_546EXC.4 EVM.evm.TU.scf_546EXC.4   scf_546EXC:68108-68524(-)